MPQNTNRIGEFRTDAAVLAAFLVLVCIMTWPQAAHLGNAARDWGDPLLNAWIMWWEVDAVTSGNFGGFFDANIFFPHHRTLAYSEFLIPQTIVGAPFLLATGNPLFAYNVVLLLSFAATAFAMYLLGKHLTGSPLAGFTAGLALAFSPFMFAHLSHIQVIGAAGFPLAFLFLHRYFDEPSLRWLLCFTAAYVGQALANTHFALYLTYAAGIYIVYRAVRDRMLWSPSFYGHMAVHAVVSLALLLPFFGQYLMLKGEMGFGREMVYSASWFSFFAAPPTNRLYGTITEALRTSEASLFPGAVVVFLAIAGIVASCRAIAAPSAGSAAAAGGSDETAATDGSGETTAAGGSGESRVPDAAVWGYRLAGALMIAAWLVIVAMSVSGGINLQVAGVSLRANDFQNPLVGLAAALLVRAALRLRFPALGRGGGRLAEPQRFYAWMLFAGLLLSLGASGPYRLLHAYVPGFDSVRAVARIHILSLFCLAVFVAYGTFWLASRLRKLDLSGAIFLVPVLILVESFSAPIPLHPVDWGDDMPDVYAWLAQQPGDHAAIEYPLEVRLEFDRMLFSAAHQKKIVNGMSGYESPVYQEMRLRMDNFPSRATIDDIRDLGVRWVIVHHDLFGDRRAAIARRLKRFERELVSVATFGDTEVFETRGTPWLTRAEVRSGFLGARGIWTALPRDRWTVRANVNDHLSALAIDGDLESRWNTEPQQPGDEFVVDLGDAATFGNIAMWLYTHPHDYPRGYRVQVSNDGESFSTVAEIERVNVPIAWFVEPLQQAFGITFPETTARYLKVVQTGADPIYVWSIHELEVRRRTSRSGGIASALPAPTEPAPEPEAEPEAGRAPPRNEAPTERRP